MAENTGTPFVRCTGHRFFAQRLVLATLTGKPVHISGIRSSSPTSPGLAPHEVSLLRLLEAVTNGSSFQISYTGTTMTYHPGLITGTVAGAGATEEDLIEHHIPAGCTRGITYFLAPLALLAPFSKAHMNVRFSGPGVITAATEAGDLSADAFRLAILPLYGLFGIPPARIELAVRQRACTGYGDRRGNGVVELRFASQVRLPRTLHLNRGAGRIRRIAGVAYTVGVTASNNKRMIHAARAVLNTLTGEIRIAEAPPAQDDARNKPGIGFGLCLVAESNVPGVVYSADVVAPARGGVLAEDIGTQCAHQLLANIAAGGCVCRSAATTVLTLMAMGAEDVGRLRLGRDVVGTQEVVALARDLKAFGASSWGLRQADDSAVDSADDLENGTSSDDTPLELQYRCISCCRYS
ncbi:RNA-3 -phosphate cyclase family protein [Grosmannia clavigera kw1407]|uniref:RNA-3-phosphate cyclase family protein n=1 Tax=Grosmannia clavigera (strain kw1407 / UAMH 11150) TaxID=655863 RepID=F0XMY2_GROCL|nr:RNA-3 -phosphate cyclase family protein [Grosmannia clavigera kw1407]EFX00833.1 RNA-3 -phosphate cyclase family protein [Grosmannia clavigera kw1407]